MIEIAAIAAMAVRTTITAFDNRYHRYHRYHRHSILLLVLVGACGGPQTDPTAGEGFRQLVADQVIAGFEQHLTEDGRHKVLMRGDTAYIFEDSALAKVRNMNIIMYDEAGHVSARLTALAGDINTAHQGMVARGNVVLITEQDGRRIETEELHFDPRTHRIWSDVRTVQHHEGGILMGSGFEADDKFQNVQIRQASSSGGGLRIQF